MNAEQRAQAAQVDVWELHGRLCAPMGGGAITLPGARLMSSGLPYGQWNSGDVSEPARVDVEAVRAWYAARAEGRGVPWGLRVIAGTPFAHGRFLFRKRLMALEPAAFRAAPMPEGVHLRRATPADLDIVAAIDGHAFGNPAEQSRAWMAHQLEASESFTKVLASVGGEAVGCAIAARTGDCTGIYGVAVRESARRRGIGSAMTSWLLAHEFEAGITLAHLNPDAENAARIYTQLGFAEVDGFDIWVEI